MSDRICGSCGGTLREVATRTIGYSHWLCNRCGIVAQEGAATPQHDLSGDYDWTLSLLRELQDSTFSDRPLLAACLVAGGVRAPAPPPEPLCRCGSTYDLETGVCNRTGILANGCDAAPLVPAPPAEGPDTATLTKKLRAVIQEHSPEHFSVAMRPEAFVQWLVANISQ